MMWTAAILLLTILCFYVFLALYVVTRIAAAYLLPVRKSRPLSSAAPKPSHPQDSSESQNPGSNQFHDSGPAWNALSG